VGVVELREGFRFPLEPLPPLGASGVMLAQDLDRDRPFETGVLRLVDFPHSPRSDGGDNLVRTQALSGAERHRGALLSPVIYRSRQSASATWITSFPNCAPLASRS
jgi:hypothetical protein